MAHIPSIPVGVGVVYAARLTYDLSHEYRYVGMTVKGSKRLRDHLSDAMNPNSAAYTHPKCRWMRKHFLQVTFDILEVVEDIKLLPQSEMKWIHILKSMGYRLLNVTDGGEGAPGLIVSAETRAKQSASAKGRRASEETKRKMSLSQTGRRHSEESKVKMSGRRGELNYGYGKTRSKEIRNKISNSMKGVKKSDETRAKMSESCRKSTAKASHTRWHVNRGLTSPDCALCLTTTDYVV